jgi:dihydrodipicolinate synthase/N-acetylneuraminate lyase
MPIIPGSTKQLCEELAVADAELVKISTSISALAGQWDVPAIYVDLPSRFAAALISKGMTAGEAEAARTALSEKLRAMKITMTEVRTLVGIIRSLADEAAEVARESAHKANQIGADTFRV